MGRDRLAQQLVDEAVIEAEAGTVDRAGSVGEHARPGNREAVRVEAELRHQGDILAVAVVVVAGNVAGVAIPDPAGRVSEAIPDALTTPIRLDAALDLVGRRSCAPHEPCREFLPGHVASSWTWERFHRNVQ